MANSDLVFRIFGIDVSAGTALDRVRFRAVETGNALETLGKTGAVAFLAVGVAAVTAAAGGVKMAIDFQRQMTLLNTQAGVSKDKVAQLGGQVLDLAGQVGFSPQSLAEALYFVESNFESLGAKAPPAMDVLKFAAEGAKVGMADLTDTTTSLTATLAAYAHTGLTAKGAMATLNAIVGTGEMTFQQLNEAIKTGVMATMQQYGVRLNEVGAALATFGDNNIRGAAAGTAFRMAVQAMAKPIKTAESTLASIGLTTTSLRDAMSQHGLTGAMNLFMSSAQKAGYDLKGFGKIQTDVAQASKKNGMSAAINTFVDDVKKAHGPTKNLGSLIMDVFGKRAGTGIAILLGEFDRFKSKIPQITAATKKFDQAWKDTSETVQVKWDKLKAKWDVFLIHLGNSLLPWITNTVIPAFDRIVTWFDTNLPNIENKWTTFWGNVGKGIDAIKRAWADVKKTLSDNVWAGSIATGLAAIAASLLLIKGYTMAVAAAEGIAALVTWGWAGAMAALDAVMDANIFVVLGVAIIGVGAALIYAYNHSVTFRNAVNSLGGAIKGAGNLWLTVFNKAVDGIVAALHVLWNALVMAKDGAISFGHDVRSVLQQIVSAFGSTARAVGGFLAAMARAAIAFGEGIRSTALQAKSALINDILGAVRAVWSFIQGTWQSVANALSRPFSTGITTIRGVVNSFFSWVGSWPGIIAGRLSGIAGVITAPFRSAISTIQGMFSNLHLSVPSIQLPSIPSIGSLFHFAAGGYPPAGMPVVVGENGPEIVTFGPGAHVWPNGTTPSRSYGGGGGGGTYVTVNVPHSVIGDEKLLAKTVVTALRKSRNRGYSGSNLDPVF